MLTIILLATIVPLLTGVAYVALRNRFPERLADIRGIALQTVIVIVVLLAIAGAVAGVLISRGDQAVADLERQDIDRPTTPAEIKAITSRTECVRWNYEWDEGAPDASPPVTAHCQSG